MTHESNRCETTGKHRYETRSFAKKRAKARAKETRGLKLYVYACQHCGGWHLTRMDRGQYATVAKILAATTEV